MPLNFKTEKKPSKKSTINDITFCFPIEDTDIFDYQFLQKIEKAMMIFLLFLIYFYWA
ncbi:hypothetical protein GNP63_03280 [Aliivibrio fischeri]|uniref:hypothetical protein n=1 Tax=Aliivibrio fischeri TaxID=668 RepID=UPI0012D98BF9|nr:hypothetical protein [Aliivibrio fischeri]MUH95578.1 hypothetical protein [Aliivibrio fischeri]MUI64269.1 hypothetical protein [Aliivibrio fischeri]MUJ19116.1 hypothetical protein [Aliivibrio fischeri]